MNENQSPINEGSSDPRVKKEAISRLSDFFRVPASNLSSFNFDGKDNIKALTKALNSTSDEGTEAYYKVAIKLAKEEVGVHESNELNEGDMTKFYDGFIVLDSKTKKTYKFKYVRGTSNVKVEDAAIDKLMKSTGSTRANFAVHGFVKKGEWNSDKTEVLESVNEGAVKAFEMDYADMVKQIKSGYGWIDPEYVGETWENSSDTIDFEIVKDEIYNRLIKAGLLYFADENDPESKGKKVTNISQIK